MTSDSDGWTPLMYSAKYGESEYTISIAKAGADVNVQNKSGRTAAYISAGAGTIECLRYLRIKMPISLYLLITDILLLDRIRNND
eukprot:UN03640